MRMVFSGAPGVRYSRKSTSEATETLPHVWYTQNNVSESVTSHIHTNVDISRSVTLWGDAHPFLGY